VRHIVLVLVVVLVLERFVVAIGAGIVAACSVGIAAASRDWRCFQGDSPRDGAPLSALGYDLSPLRG